MFRYAEPFVAAAVAGLCAKPGNHSPEDIARDAVAIGNAVAERFSPDAEPEIDKSASEPAIDASAYGDDEPDSSH